MKEVRGHLFEAHGTSSSFCDFITTTSDFQEIKVVSLFVYFDSQIHHYNVAFQVPIRLLMDQKYYSYYMDPNSNSNLAQPYDDP